MKKYYVIYHGYSSGLDFCTECDDKKEAYIFATCFSYMVIKMNWTYGKVRIVKDISKINHKFSHNKHKFTKNEIYEESKRLSKTSGWL